MPDRNQLLGWWYVSIGIGFALLAVRYYLVGARPFAIVLRGIIAAGFLLLGMATLNTPKRD
ncbi:MAG TPA: hypothetical protein VK419_05995 [Bryobacteraceae bacterium]|nr:hypothetical protein [Bryobacteraceae bacterium]